MIYVIHVCEVLIHDMAAPTIFRLQTAILPTAKKKQQKQQQQKINKKKPIKLLFCSCPQVHNQFSSQLPASQNRCGN